MPEPTLTDEHADLMAKLDQAFRALDETKLDPSAHDFANLERDALLLKLAGLKATHGGEHAGDDAKTFRRDLGSILRALQKLRKQYDLDFTIPRIFPAWQFWR